MRRRIPNLPIICDPSHIGGKRELVAPLCQQAMDLGFNGLIVESHCNPDCAWSDAAQQVTPEQLGELLAGIRWRRETVDVPQFEADMERLRLEIDQIDAQLFALLSRRMGIAEDIGRIKRENDVIILQRRRWDEIVDNMVARAGELGLSPEFIRTILDAIHMESIARQNVVMNP